MPTRLELQIAKAKAAAARRARALNLRRQGKTLVEIAQALDLKSHQHAQQLVNQAIEDELDSGDEHA